MPLARAWWRGSAWAVAATLVVPGALAIAVATIALGGGLRSLGTVAQVVTGPGVPEARLQEHRVTQPTDSSRATPLPSVPTVSSAGGATPPIGTPSAGTAPQSSGSTPSTPSSSSTPVARRPAASAPASGGTSGAAPTSPSNGGGPQPANPVRDTGKAVAGAAGSTLPAPAGPAAADAVTTVLDLVAPGPRAALPAP